MLAIWVHCCRSGAGKELHLLTSWARAWCSDARQLFGSSAWFGSELAASRQVFSTFNVGTSATKAAGTAASTVAASSSLIAWAIRAPPLPDKDTQTQRS